MDRFVNDWEQYMKNTLIIILAIVLAADSFGQEETTLNEQKTVKSIFEVFLIVISQEICSLFHDPIGFYRKILTVQHSRFGKW